MRDEIELYERGFEDERLNEPFLTLSPARRCNTGPADHFTFVSCGLCGEPALRTRPHILAPSDTERPDEVPGEITWVVFVERVSRSSG